MIPDVVSEAAFIQGATCCATFTTDYSTERCLQLHCPYPTVATGDSHPVVYSLNRSPCHRSLLYAPAAPMDAVFRPGLYDAAARPRKARSVARRAEGRAG